jgi:ubiquinone/menaquinone biosynthesis C-methylase UbiE
MMADESMVRTLAAQTEAIWPQELPLYRRYGLPDDVRVLDAGCGTGEASMRLAELYPSAQVLGVDIIDAQLAYATARGARFGDRVRFDHRSIYELGLPDGAFDLTVCRHVIHSIPYPERVLAELVRVTRPGGRVHIIAEDYGMIHFPPRALDADAFWRVAPRDFGRSTGTDLFVGRRTYSLLRHLGVRDITVDYVVVDTLRVPRETFARIFAAWRDGYAAAIGEHTSISAADAVAHLDDLIATIRDDDSYCVWHVPVIAGILP